MYRTTLLGGLTPITFTADTVILYKTPGVSCASIRLNCVPATTILKKPPTSTVLKKINVRALIIHYTANLAGTMHEKLI